MPRFQPLRVLWPSLLALSLAGCGGGGGDASSALQCSVPQQQNRLRSYMQDWYFWNQASPDPAPQGFSTVDSYFAARLYTGTLVDFPVADVWSYVSSSADYQQFFSANQTLGYGLMVNGLEVGGQADQPLRVRYVEPGSPAAAAGLVRGDVLTRINGQPAAVWVAADDFSVFSPSAAGQSITLEVSNSAGSRSLSLSAAVYNLVPVVNAAVLSTASGRKVGTLLVKDMVDAALPALDSAFAQFQTAGVQDLVLDLRYNGGGLVAVGRTLASYVSRIRTAGATYATLWFNAQHRSSDRTFTFDNPAAALTLSRVYVLTGPRTCSASEQVINGLAPYVDVVQVGDVSCGKPVGFVPWEDGCGSVYSVVNFESINAASEGRYFNGLAPNAGCEVAEDLAQPLGSASEPLLAAALRHIETGSCAGSAAVAGRASVLGLRKPGASVLRNALGQARRPGWREPGERGGMGF